MEARLPHDACHAVGLVIGRRLASWAAESQASTFPKFLRLQTARPEPRRSVGHGTAAAHDRSQNPRSCLSRSRWASSQVPGCRAA